MEAKQQANSGNVGQMPYTYEYNSPNYRRFRANGDQQTGRMGKVADAIIGYSQNNNQFARRNGDYSVTGKVGGYVGPIIKNDPISLPSAGSKLMERSYEQH